METLGSLLYYIRANNSDFKQKMDESKKKVKEFDDRVQKSKKELQDWTDKAKKVGVVATTIFAGVATAGLYFLKAASDAQEMQNVLEVSFGEMSDDINKWAEETASAVNRSNYQMKNFVSTAMTMTRSMVDSKDEAAKMSETIAQLSVDLASFKNISDTKMVGWLKGIVEYINELPGPVKEIAAQGMIITEFFAGIVGPLGLFAKYLPKIATGLGSILKFFKPFLIGGAIVMGIIAIKNAFSGLGDMQEDTYDKTKNLVNEYERLKSKTELTKKEKDELRRVTAELARKYPDAVKGIDSETNAFELSTEAILENEKAKHLAITEQNIKNRIDEITSSIKNFNKNIQQAELDKVISGRRSSAVTEAQFLKDGLLGLIGYTQEELDEISLEDLLMLEETEKFQNLMAEAGEKAQKVWNEGKKHIVVYFALVNNKNSDIENFKTKIAELNEELEKQQEIYQALQDLYSGKISFDQYQDILEKINEIELEPPSAEEIEETFGKTLSEMSDRERKIRITKLDKTKQRKGLEVDLEADAEPESGDDLENRWISTKNEIALLKVQEGLEKEMAALELAKIAELRTVEEGSAEELDIREKYRLKASQLIEKYSELREQQMKYWNDRYRLLIKEGLDYELEANELERENALKAAKERSLALTATEIEAERYLGQEKEKINKVFDEQEAQIREKYREAEEQAEIEANRQKEQRLKSWNERYILLTKEGLERELEENRIARESALAEAQKLAIENNESKVEAQEQFGQEEIEINKVFDEQAAQIRERYHESEMQAELRKQQFLLQQREISYYDYLGFIEKQLEAEEKYSDTWYSLMQERQNTLNTIVQNEMKDYQEQSEEMFKDENERITWLIDKLMILKEHYADNNIIVHLLGEEIKKLRDNITDPPAEDSLNWLENMFVNVGYKAEEAQRNFQGFRDGLVDGLTAAITKGEDFLATLNNIADQIEALIVKKGIVEPFVDWMFASLFPTGHTGGLITFNGIETFHTGGMAGMKPLRPDEKIIKTKVGEIILNQEQQKGIINSQQSTRPEVNVEVINNTGTPIQTRKEVKFDGTRTIVRMFMEGYARNVDGIQDIIKRR